MLTSLYCLCRVKIMAGVWSIEHHVRLASCKQVHSDNDASEEGIMGHLGKCRDILGHFGSI